MAEWAAGPDLLAALRRRTPELLAATEALVEVESPSADLAAVARGVERVAEVGERVLGAAPERLAGGGWPALRWRFGTPRVLLLAHLDTVWPLGTLARWPFRVEGDRASGPGIFDMKAGLVQGLFAVAALASRDGVELLVNADEELGSPGSRALIEDAAAGMEAALVLEPSAGGALKVGRKGVATYALGVEGRAAHAGLEPERGANALVELAGAVLAAAALARPERGTTVTPTVAAAGSATNVVPAVARADLDVRVTDAAEQERIDAALAALAAGRRGVPGTRLTVAGGQNRPPLHPSAAAGLFARARSLGEALGLGPLAGVSVGGGSDGNFTAALGTPTLDGLGAVGAGAHAEGEHVEVGALAERAALVAALVADLLADLLGRGLDDPPRTLGA